MMNYIMIIYCQLPSKATVKTEKYNYIKTQIIVSVMPFITMWSMADEDIISGVNRPQDMYNFPIKLSNEIIISAVTSRLFNYLIHFILLVFLYIYLCIIPDFRGNTFSLSLFGIMLPQILCK